MIQLLILNLFVLAYKNYVNFAQKIEENYMTIRTIFINCCEAKNFKGVQ